MEQQRKKSKRDKKHKKKKAKRSGGGKKDKKDKKKSDAVSGVASQDDLLQMSNDPLHFTPKELNAATLMSFSWKVRTLSRRLETYYYTTVMATSTYDLAFKEIVTLMDRDKNLAWVKSDEYQNWQDALQQ